MKSRLMLMISSVVVFGLTACDVKKEEKSYSYDYTLNGCNTGKQEFSSQEDMCRGLRDDARNNYCASSIRADAYQQSCAGMGIVSEESEILEEGDF